MESNSERSYGSVAKTLHWLIAAILVVQFPLGWLMPAVRRGMQPGPAMNAHISIGILVLALIVLRFLWRVTHPVPAEPELPAWQLNASLAVHWLLYALVLLTTLCGWFFASARGWTLSFFSLFPLPALVAGGSRLGRALGELHETLAWVLLGVVALHMLAALAHAFIYRDQVMQRMLPGR